MRTRQPVPARFAPRRRTARRAFVLLVVALVLPLVTAALAVGVDIARGLSARRSLEGLAESAAMMAALELDGTPEGEARARDRALGAMGLEEDQAAEIKLDIDASGRAAATVTGPPVAWLIPGFAGRRVVGRAAAAQSRWEPPAGRVRDLGLDGAEPRPGEWIALSRSAVADGAADLCGAAVTVVVEVDLDERVARDTDRFSPDYAQYRRGRRGNGSRILPVRLGGRVGGLFVARGPETPDSADRLWCGEFVGGFLEGAGNRAAAAEGYWRVEVDDR